MVLVVASCMVTTIERLQLATCKSIIVSFCPVSIAIVAASLDILFQRSRVVAWKMEVGGVQQQRAAMRMGPLAKSLDDYIYIYIYIYV